MSKPIAQVGLVHGGGIERVPYAEDMFQLQPGSIARIGRGIELLQAGSVERLVLSGGNAHGDDLPQTEAGLMADIAVTAAGIPAAKIIVEEKSSSTIGNWANSLGIFADEGIESVVGITGRVARPRAQGIGTAMIHHFGLDVKLVGYHTTKEPIGVSVVREGLSVPANAAWLANAVRKGRSLGELDAAYRDRRKNSPIAKVKQQFTHR